ncbi:MAG: hypothetical protein ACJAZO_000299 [Myxococcota bacterium]|jgi:hypothetical protein
MYNTTPRLISVLARPDNGLQRIIVPGHLAVHLIDTSTEERLTEAQLTDLAVSPLSAFVGGRRERQRSAHGIRSTTHPQVPAIRMITDISGDAASHLLCLRDLIQPFPAGGALVVVPSRSQLMALPLTDISSVGWLDVLTQAGRQSYQRARHPISPDVYWVDGSQYERFEQTNADGELILHPPLAFRAVVQRLAQRALRRVDAVA